MGAQADFEELCVDDVLVIGSGIAGLTAALTLADQGQSVTVITRAESVDDCNTRWAQGGIIYTSDKDSPELLLKDILAAGAGFCQPDIARLLAENGPGHLHQFLLERLSVPFDRDEKGDLAVCQEAAHSTERIIHAKDATGLAIQKALSAAVADQPLIDVLTAHTAIDLITPDHHSVNPLSVYQPKSCVGAYVLDQKHKKVKRILAKNTLLASGGLGQIYMHTSNPKGSRGDGIAMANRAGARIINTEFVQFHPTTFYKKGAPNFLISEAVRGAGARLVDIDGQPFMQKYAPKWLDLAPRDVVSRSIFNEMLRTDSPCMYLDLKSHLSAAEITDRFPNIHQFCLNHGVDITKQLVPVTPAAHYACGGVWVNDKGQTDINQLYAIGEVACTGLHGANRLASTSLLEGLVWGVESANEVAKLASSVEAVTESEIPLWEAKTDNFADEVLIQHDMQRIGAIMWNYVGVSRSPERLIRALRELRNLETEIEQFYRNNKVSDALIGLRNMVRTSVIITLAAWSNKRSVGCHFREDAEQ